MSREKFVGCLGLGFFEVLSVFSIFFVLVVIVAGGVSSSPAGLRALFEGDKASVSGVSV